LGVLLVKVKEELVFEGVVYQVVGDRNPGLWERELFRSDLLVGVDLLVLVRGLQGLAFLKGLSEGAGFGRADGIKPLGFLDIGFKLLLDGRVFEGFGNVLLGVVHGVQILYREVVFGGLLRRVVREVCDLGRFGYRFGKKVVRATFVLLQPTVEQLGERT
jgi:hypothetical protein